MLDTSQELFDIVDENDMPLGIVKPRDLVHMEKQDWHRSTTIYIVNKDNQLLCQQRSMRKDANPGDWQCFFGGHVQAGETYDQNAIKELGEEIGLQIHSSELIFIGKGKGEKDKHHDAAYVYEWKGNEPELVLNDGEVAQVKWMSLEEYAELRKMRDNSYHLREILLEFITQRK